MDLVRRIEETDAGTSYLDAEILRAIPMTRGECLAVSVDLQVALRLIPYGTKAVLTIDPGRRSSAQLVFEIDYEYAPFGRLVVPAPGNEKQSEAKTAALALCAAIIRFWEAKAQTKTTETIAK